MAFLQAHLVHWNTDLFKDFGEAAQADNGLTVLGVFLKVVIQDSLQTLLMTQYASLQVGQSAHPGFQKVLDLVKDVPYSGDSCEVKGGYDPSLLLPEDCSKYWTYLGSLTTPPCYESVNWVVFKEPLEVSSEQVLCISLFMAGKINDMIKH
jgi:carbonic anhydrase